ncbi:MAG: helix-turn-helix transcriptional regulator [Chitinophagaceae bacterium]
MEKVTPNKRLIDLTIEEFLGYLDERELKANKSTQGQRQEKFLKVKECATLTRYTEDYIRQLVFMKKIPSIKLNNGSLRFSYPEIIAWMRSIQRIPLEEVAQNYIENSPLYKKDRFFPG